jgi:hypothetical protein
MYAWRDCDLAFCKFLNATCDLFQIAPYCSDWRVLSRQFHFYGKENVYEEDFFDHQ